MVECRKWALEAGRPTDSRVSLRHLTDFSHSSLALFSPHLVSDITWHHWLVTNICRTTKHTTFLYIYKQRPALKIRLWLFSCSSVSEHVQRGGCLPDRHDRGKPFFLFPRYPRSSCHVSRETVPHNEDDGRWTLPFMDARCKATRRRKRRHI